MSTVEVVSCLDVLFFFDTEEYSSGVLYVILFLDLALLIGVPAEIPSLSAPDSYLLFVVVELTTLIPVGIAKGE